MDKSKVFEVEIANSSPKSIEMLSAKAMAILDQAETNSKDRGALLSEKEKFYLWG